MPSRSITRRAIAATLAGAALAPASAAAAPPALQVEQFNRATGTAGAYGLTDFFPYTRPGGVTDNGRYVFFDVRKVPFPDPDEWMKDAIPGEGLWVRDIVANTTKRISTDGGGVFTGIDATSHVISFITSEGLAGAADTNGQPDLYAYEPLTGIKLLISRANGLGGKALGLTSFGTVTRGSTVALFGTQDGIIRRELLRGRNTKVADGSFVAPLSADALFPVIGTTADLHVSNDARVFTTDAGVVTPGGVVPLPTDDIGRPVRPWVNEAGTKLVWQQTLQDLSGVRVRNVATGVVTAPPVPAAFGQEPTGIVHRPTPDGSGVFLGYTEEDAPGVFRDTMKKWTFASGAVTDKGPLTLISRNERFGITGTLTGALLVGAAPGTNLPGGADLPSAIAYVNYEHFCSYDEEGQPQNDVEVASAFARNVPTATTVRFRAATGAGQPWTVDQTVPAANDDDWHPEQIVKLPFADGAFRLEVTVTLADGRSITSVVDHGPRAIPDGC